MQIRYPCWKPISYKLTIMAFSSMLLGGTTRPPYWNVFFRFCSHAFAMPVTRHMVASRGLGRRAQRGFIHSVGVRACMRVCVFTLILRSGAEGGLLQVFEQEGFEDLGAAVEGSQDVEQPPASLATITAMTRGRTDAPGITGLGEGAERVCETVCLHAWLGCGVKTGNVFEQTYGLELVFAVSCLSSWQ